MPKDSSIQRQKKQMCVFILNTQFKSNIYIIPQVYNKVIWYPCNFLPQKDILRTINFKKCLKNIKFPYRTYSYIKSFLNYI